MFVRMKHVFPPVHASGAEGPGVAFVAPPGREGGGGIFCLRNHGLPSENFVGQTPVRVSQQRLHRLPRLRPLPALCRPPRPCVPTQIARRIARHDIPWHGNHEGVMQTADMGDELL